MLCLILTFVHPGMGLYHIFSSTIPTLSAARDPRQQLLLGGYAVIFLCLSVLSFMAGLRLWLVKPGAVQFARRYLLLCLFGNIAYFVFWIIVTRPTQAASLAEMSWYHVAGPAPGIALWYFYLEHSKRVRSTYFEA